MSLFVTLARSLPFGAIVMVVGCGGKILDDGTIGPGSSATSGGTSGGQGSGAATSGGVGAPGSGGAGSVPTSPVASVTCGATSCDGATQECCITVGGGGGSTSSSGGGGGPPIDATCTPKGKCRGDIALACSSGASCSNGDVCCADLNLDVPVATCQPSCGGGGGGGGGGGPRGRTQLCASDKECPRGQTCQDTSAGFKFCRRAGGGGGGGGGGGASSNGGP